MPCITEDLQVVTNKKFRVLEKELGAKIQWAELHIGDAKIDSIVCTQKSIFDPKFVTCPLLIFKALKTVENKLNKKG